MYVDCSLQVFTLFERLPVQKDTLFKTLDGEIIYPVRIGSWPYYRGTLNGRDDKYTIRRIHRTVLILQINNGIVIMLRIRIYFNNK